MSCIECSRPRAYLTTKDVLYVHECLLRRYGGAEGIVNPAGLASAVARASSGHYAGIPEEAAALAESLLINHPFRDGNKRTAFACADVFLRLNGIVIKGDDHDLCDMVYAWLAVPSSVRLRLMASDFEALIKDL